MHTLCALSWQSKDSPKLGEIWDIYSVPMEMSFEIPEFTDFSLILIQIFKVNLWNTKFKKCHITFVKALANFQASLDILLYFILDIYLVFFLYLKYSK